MDDVYEVGGVHRPLCRRVIALLDGRVFYSTGGNRNRSCLEKTMRRWMRHAALIHEGKSPRE